VTDRSLERTRQEGLRAFVPGVDPKMRNPYRGLALENWSRYWMLGWDEAARRHELTILDENHRTEEKLDEFVRLYELAKARGLI